MKKGQVLFKVTWTDRSSPVLQRWTVTNIKRPPRRWPYGKLPPWEAEKPNRRTQR